MTFKEYIAMRTASALETSYFQPEGNSALAVYNKSLFANLRHECKGLYQDIKYVANQPVLSCEIGDLLALVVTVPLFPFFVMSRAYCRSSTAEKALRKDWEFDSIEAKK
tara:strand:- start:187 stop:513 length:327 start_codon:yes stop_codon:yes gene_type:complete